MMLKPLINVISESDNFIVWTGTKLDEDKLSGSTKEAAQVWLYRQALLCGTVKVHPGNAHQEDRSCFLRKPDRS